jgi:predicted phosphodiesterase
MKQGGLENLIAKLGKELTRVAVYSDVHSPYENTEALSCANQIIHDYKPHKIIIIGDFMDMESVSHWLENRKKTLEGKRVLKEYEHANTLLNYMVKNAGSQLEDVYYLEGNHEFWMRDYVDKNPQVEGLLELQQNIKLANNKVKLSFVDMNAYLQVGKAFFTHGMYTNKYHAFKHVDMIGKNIFYGHVHDIQMFTKAGLADPHDKQMACSIGCLCDMSPSYMKNRPHNWMHGIMLMDVLKNGNFTPLVIPIIGGKASILGKTYHG